MLVAWLGEGTRTVAQSSPQCHGVSHRPAKCVWELKEVLCLGSGFVTHEGMQAVEEAGGGGGTKVGYKGKLLGVYGKESVLCR